MVFPRGTLVALVCATTALAGVSASLVAQDISVTGKTPEQLVQLLKADADIAISNVAIGGSHLQFGTFAGGADVISLGTGVVLGSGHVKDIDHNNDGSIDTDLGGSGDGDISNLTKVSSHDAATLTFDFVPKSKLISVSYVFASEEYEGIENSPTEYVDAMAILVNGKNCAITQDGRDVNVNAVNGIINSDFYMDNSQGQHGIELHGFTKVLTCLTEVVPDQVNTMKLVVADGKEGGYDTAVFLGAKSFGPPPGSRCRRHEPRGKCLRLLTGGDYRHPVCQVDRCHAGYSLDESGDECCDVHYITGYRKCDSFTAALTLGRDDVCCNAVTVTSVRPNGRSACLQD